MMIDCKDIACLQIFKRPTFSRNLIQATRCLSMINHKMEFLDFYITCAFYIGRRVLYVEKFLSFRTILDAT